jgi:hypothetical protein
MTIFTEMDTITDGSGNEYFAKKLAAAIKKYILTGQVSTNDKGAAPAGDYTGEGTGTTTIDADSLESDLLATFENNYGDDDLAAHMAIDIDAACTADDTVQVNSKGIVTTPSGATSEFSGPGKGKLSGTKATIENGLKACFVTMKSMTAVGGNAEYALQFSICFTSYLTTGKVDTELQVPPFAAGTGSGAIA